MTPNDTIREALRRCPVETSIGSDSFALAASGDGFVWRHASGWTIEEHDCNATNAMIAAWVEALIEDGHVPRFLRTAAGRGVDLTTRQLSFEAATTLHTLAAAVCAVMPEPSKETTQ